VRSLELPTDPAEEAIDQPVRRALALGDRARAATLIIEHHGPGVLGFLVARLESRVRGGEVFSMFSEDLWTGLPGFRWECAVRGWVYALARNAAHRYLVDEGRRRRRTVRWDTSEWSRQAARLQTRTQPYLQTPIRSRVRALRSQLSAEDQALLILRIGRRLPWRELAVALSAPDAQLSQADLERESARLRKRFSLATAQLKALAQAEGLLPAREP
jgi:RNA polymerase sigma-70 factor, ECF subfamily